MELNEGVMFVEHGGVPGFWNEAHEALFGGGCVGARDEAEALGDAEMMAIDAERSPAQRGEIDHSSAGLGSNAWKLFEPGADLVGAVLGKEVERKRAVAGGNALQGFFELWGFLVGEGDDGDRAFELGDGGIADGLPVAGSGMPALPILKAAFKVAHHLVRDRRLGARGEQRVDELRQRVHGLAWRRLAVAAQQQAMNVRQLIGLLGSERAAPWIGALREVGIGEKLGHRFLSLMLPAPSRSCGVGSMCFLGESSLKL